MNPLKADHDSWLAEAARALAEAEKATGMLALTRPRHDLVLASLQSEIMSLRRQIERLIRERSGEIRSEFHPEWMEYSVWNIPRR